MIDFQGACVTQAPYFLDTLKQAGNHWFPACFNTNALARRLCIFALRTFPASIFR